MKKNNKSAILASQENFETLYDKSFRIAKLSVYSEF